VSEQWFVHMGPLAEPALAAVADGRITILPERFEKIYNGWLENIKVSAWCIFMLDDATWLRVGPAGVAGWLHQHAGGHLVDTDCQHATNSVACCRTAASLAC